MVRHDARWLVPRLRLHRKVWLAWNSWIAIQVQMPATLALGVRVELGRPMVDLYIGPVTLAIGRHPCLTDDRVRRADSCRGFCFADQEIL